jgi:hypothetical protein
MEEEKEEDINIRGDIKSNPGSGALRETLDTGESQTAFCRSPSGLVKHGCTC